MRDRDGGPARAANGVATPWTGVRPAEHRAERLRAVAAAGARRAVVWPPATSCTGLRLIARRVAPRV
ncbi:hypothetical protein [Miltoncostaea marina]|uniref:hypothetical protein n=1 Tax=Miltoncostaea marina TaxID=2843215 RepID=UPI001C3DB945|nr:hypothetical protein [Miltoncostaea marina]